MPYDLQILICVASFSKKLSTFPREKLTGVGTSLPELIVYLDQAAIIPAEERKNEDKSVADTVAVVQYNGKELQKYNMETHKEVETVIDSMLNTDWRDLVNIGAKYAENRQEVLDTLAEF